MMDENAVVMDIMGILQDSDPFINLLDKFEMDGVSRPMMLQGALMPEEWGIKCSTVMIYAIFNRTSLEYGSMRLMAACRASSYIRSRQLAYALHDALNRRGNERIFALCDVLQTIPPDDGETDNYNTPVEIAVRGR